MSNAAEIAANQPDLPLGFIGAVPMRLTATVVPEDMDGFIAGIGSLPAAIDTAVNWQTASANAHFREIGATGNGAEANRTYNLIRYQAAAGEKLALACTAGIEAALWVRHRADSSDDGMGVMAEMVHRAIAELQAYYLLAAGHDVINIVARALALDKSLRVHLLNAVGTGFPVGSHDRSDYLTINRETARQLRKVAQRAKSQSFTVLADALCELAINSAWQTMLDQRGEHFHRLRKQSHGIVGLPEASPWVLHEGGRSMDFGLPATYTEAEGLALELTRQNQAAMDALVTAMTAFGDALKQALDDLCMGRLGWS